MTFFSFCTLMILLHCLLACSTSDKIICCHTIFDPQYEMCPLSLATFMIFSLSLEQIVVLWCNFLHASCAQGSLNFIICEIICLVSSSLANFWPLFLQIFFFSTLLSSMNYIYVYIRSLMAFPKLSNILLIVFLFYLSIVNSGKFPLLYCYIH